MSTKTFMTKRNNGRPCQEGRCQWSNWGCAPNTHTYKVILSFSNCPSLLKSRFFFCKSLFETWIRNCNLLSGRSILNTVLSCQSAYLLLFRPSFTSEGKSFSGISFSVYSHSPLEENRASYFSPFCSKLAENAVILSFHATSEASGYFDFNASVTSDGIFLSCAKDDPVKNVIVKVSSEIKKYLFILSL